MTLFSDDATQVFAHVKGLRMTYRNHYKAGISIHSTLVPAFEQSYAGTKYAPVQSSDLTPGS